MSLLQYQLSSYQCVQEQFQNQYRLRMSGGSIYTFNQQAFAGLEQVEQKLISRLHLCGSLHSDETGVDIDGKTLWLRGESNAL